MFDVVPSRPLLLVLTCPLAGRSWASRCRGSPASHLSTGLEHTVSVTRLFRGKESFFAIARCMKELSLTSWRPFPCNLYNVSLSVEVSRFSVLSRDRLWSSAKEQVFNKQIKVNQGVITDETVHSWRFHNHPQSQHCSFWPRNDSVLSSCQTALSVLSQAASWQSSAFLELWDKMWSLLYSKFPGAEQKS